MTKEQQRFLESHAKTLTAVVRGQGFSVNDPGFWMDEADADSDFEGWATFGVLTGNTEPDGTQEALVLGFTFLDIDGFRSVVAQVCDLFLEGDPDEDPPCEES